MSNDSKGKEVRWVSVCAVMALLVLVVLLGFICWIGFIYP